MSASILISEETCCREGRCRPLCPPPGWSMDPEGLDNETNWAPEGSLGHSIGNIYALGTCVPVMCDVLGGVIFRAGWNFYDTSLINFEVRQITFPKTLDEIIAVMKEQGYRALKLNRLPLCGKHTAPTSESVYLERWRDAMRKA